MSDKLLSQLTEEDFGTVHRTVEAALVALRDSRISLLSNTGMVIEEKDGEHSCTIRLSAVDVFRLGAAAIISTKAEPKKVDADTGCLFTNPATGICPGCIRCN